MTTRIGFGAIAIALLVCAALLALDANSVSGDAGTGYDDLKMGDADCNGLVDTRDFKTALSYYSDIPSGVTCAALADTNCDGNLDAPDALRILAYWVGLGLPVGGNCPPVGADYNHPQPTNSPPPGPTQTPVPTPTPTQTATPTPTPPSTPTPVPTTSGPTNSPTPTHSPTPIPTPTPVPTPTPDPTPTPVPTTPGPTPTPAPTGYENKKPGLIGYTAQPNSVWDTPGCGNTTVLASMRVIEDSEIAYVRASWRTRNGDSLDPATPYQTVSMTYNSSTNRWQVDLDPDTITADEGRLEYYMEAADIWGNSARYPGGFYLIVPEYRCDS